MPPPPVSGPPSGPDVVVFVPISFMSGNLGKMFREFGLTIASATLLSTMATYWYFKKKNWF